MTLSSLLFCRARILQGLCLLAYTFNTSCQVSETPQPLVLNALFTDHMVLQQKSDVSFWGNFTPGQKIAVSSSWGEQVSTVVNEEGQWSLQLTTPKAGGPFDVTIEGKDTTAIITDVMVGEVWLASGQSNMEMPLTGFLPNEPIDNYQNEIANANNANIRMFTVARNFSSTMQDSVIGNWQVCNPNTADKFSASAYFFARKLQQELNVPIGIIHSSWGGTEAEAWTSKAGLSKFPEFIGEIDAYNEDQVAVWVDQFESIPRPNDLQSLESLDLQDSVITAIGYDDSNWPQVSLPHDGCKAEVYISGAEFSGNLNGVFWYRTTFDVEDISMDYQLSIGAIDDADVTYVNGHKVGATLGWQTNRVYEVPGSILKEGQNVVAIKHYDSGGGSDVRGPIFLEGLNGRQINLEGTWSGLFYADLRNQDLIVYGIEHQNRLNQRPASIHIGPNQLASSLFNAMLHPLIPYTIKGAIWYQGESNVGRAEQYEQLFPGMIKDWRTHWGYDFPFYFVQIAPFSYGNQLSPALRDAQRLSLATPFTGMAITMDIGDSLSIHPGNKQQVGNRLALLALHNDYEKDVVSSGPLYRQHEVNESFLDITFDYVGSGLMPVDQLIGFEIAGADGIFVSAEAVIMEDNTVRLSARQVANPIYARYGWKDYLVPSLFNKEGLPASSFATN